MSKETTDPVSSERLRLALYWTFQRLSIDGGMTPVEQRLTHQEIGNLLLGRPTPEIDAWKERIKNDG